MKKAVFFMMALFVAFCLNAQQTHNLNWNFGAATTPVDLTIDVGDTVIWTNTDTVTHTVTSDGNSTESFDGSLSPGATFSVTFTMAGDNPYHCTPHPGMTGTITVINPPPACPDPSNLTASNVTEDSVEISWTENGTATEWELEYGPDGFAQGSGTIVQDNDGTLGETLTGLTSATEYDVYVRSICGADMSNWIGPENFLTDTPSGVEDNGFEGFSYYPNPVKDNMTFKAAEKIETISIYNILGRKVLETHPDQVAPVVQLSRLQPGAYILNVVINGATGTYKFIKR